MGSGVGFQQASVAAAAPSAPHALPSTLLATIVLIRLATGHEIALEAEFVARPNPHGATDRLDWILEMSEHQYSGPLSIEIGGITSTDPVEGCASSDCSSWISVMPQRWRLGYFYMCLNGPRCAMGFFLERDTH
jgi:hypothetical protein